MYPFSLSALCLASSSWHGTRSHTLCRGIIKAFNTATVHQLTAASARPIPLTHPPSHLCPAPYCHVTEPMAMLTIKQFLVCVVLLLPDKRTDKGHSPRHTHTHTYIYLNVCMRRTGKVCWGLSNSQICLAHIDMRTWLEDEQVSQRLGPVDSFSSASFSSFLNAASISQVKQTRTIFARGRFGPIHSG